MSKEKNIMARIFQNPWFGGTVIFAFAGIGCLFTIKSYFADKHNLNGFFLVVGIVLGLAAAFCLYKANATSTGVGE